VKCRVFILPIGFGGGLLDPETGLVHLRAREHPTKACRARSFLAERCVIEQGAAPQGA